MNSKEFWLVVQSVDDEPEPIAICDSAEEALAFAHGHWRVLHVAVLSEVLAGPKEEGKNYVC